MYLNIYSFTSTQELKDEKIAFKQQECGPANVIVNYAATQKETEQILPARG